MPLGGKVPWRVSRWRAGRGWGGGGFRRGGGDGGGGAGERSGGGGGAGGGGAAAGSAGDISCHVSGQLTARTASSGEISYKGNPSAIDYSPKKGLKKID